MTAVLVIAGSVVFFGLLGVLGDLVTDEVRVRFQRVLGDTGATVRLIALLMAVTGLAVIIVTAVTVLISMIIDIPDARYLGFGIGGLGALIARSAFGRHIPRWMNARSGSGTAD